MRIEFQKAEVRALREARRRAALIASRAARLRKRADGVQQAALVELLADYAGWFPEGAQLAYGPDGVPVALEWDAAPSPETSEPRAMGTRPEA